MGKMNHQVIEVRTRRATNISIAFATLSIIAAAILLASRAAADTPKAAYVWNQLAEGLHYAKHSFSAGVGQTTIHAFQVDPKGYRIAVATAEVEALGATAAELARKEGAAIVINGGFFTPEHRSIGLIVKGGRELNPIHRTSWWSIFAMSGDRAMIMTPKEFKSAKDVAAALQAGPRLVVDGAVPRLKEGEAARSAVGITGDGKVVLAVTQGASVSMSELARRMGATRFDGGLECPNAMALDGGGSSQLYAKVKRFELSIPGIARVTNGLAVSAK